MSLAVYFLAVNPLERNRKCKKRKSDDKRIYCYFSARKLEFSSCKFPQIFMATSNLLIRTFLNRNHGHFGALIPTYNSDTKFMTARMK